MRLYWQDGDGPFDLSAPIVDAANGFTRNPVREPRNQRLIHRSRSIKSAPSPAGTHGFRVTVGKSSYGKGASNSLAEAGDAHFLPSHPSDAGGEIYEMCATDCHSALRVSGPLL